MPTHPTTKSGTRPCVAQRNRSLPLVTFGKAAARLPHIQLLKAADH
jgi:hypothetical protein